MQSVSMEKVCWQQSEAAGHIASSVMKAGGGRQHAFSFLCSLRPQPRRRCCAHSQQIFLSYLNVSRSAITEECFHGDFIRNYCDVQYDTSSPCKTEDTNACSITLQKTMTWQTLPRNDRQHMLPLSRHCGFCWVQKQEGAGLMVITLLVQIKPV